MNPTALIFLSLNFSLFIGGAFAFFSKPSDTHRQRNVNSILLVCAMMALLGLVSRERSATSAEFILGISILSLSLLIFLWTAWTNRQVKLTPIYSQNEPQHLVQSGPYRFVRHPYYSAYLLSFVGGGILSGTTLSLPVFLLVLHIYVGAADQEEGKFLNSSFAETYRKYRERTGMFFPKLTL